MSALTASAIDAYQFSRDIRRRNIPTVLGGLHATTCQEEAGEQFTSVVVGDGETSWQELTSDLIRGEIQPLYQATRPFNLAEAPLPRLDLLGARTRPRFTLQTQRGCPFACEFCGASRLLGPFREKPIDLIERELEAIAEIDPNPAIELADDNTFASPGRAEALAGVFQRHRVRWFTEADWRLGERPDALAQLSEAGCAQLLIGIESLVFKYPGMGRKQAELDRIMNAIDSIQNAGIPVLGCFIVGGDGETQTSVERMAEFIESTSLADIQLTLQTPFPGTALFRRLADDGRLLADRDWSYYTLFDVTYAPDRMSVEELEAAFGSLVERIFRGDEVVRRGAIRRSILRGATTT